MLQSCGDQGFPDESIPGIAARLQKLLERDDSAKPPVARFEDDALDSRDFEQACECEPCGAGTDDADLSSQVPSSSTTRWKTWNALFAAGTPQ